MDPRPLYVSSRDSFAGTVREAHPGSSPGAPTRYAYAMRARRDDADQVPAEPDIDENGVDRAQIRAMLQLTPEERLLRVEEFIESIIEIRKLNEERPVR